MSIYEIFYYFPYNGYTTWLLLKLFFCGKWYKCFSKKNLLDYANKSVWSIQIRKSLFFTTFSCLQLSWQAQQMVSYDRLDALCTDTPPISSLNYIKCLLLQIREERSPLTSDMHPALSAISIRTIKVMKT